MFEKEIKKILATQTVIAEEHIVLEKPISALGDYAFPCFVLSKEKKKNPVDIAKEIAEKIHAPFLEKVEAKGPYVNFFIKKTIKAKEAISVILQQKKEYGRKKKNGQKVLVEYSGPNTNKPLHLGHLRNDSTGMAVALLLEANGYEVIKANIFSNRGIHICKSMLAYQKWGKGKKPDKKTDHFVGDYYILFEKNKTEALEKEAQELLQKWEKGDAKTKALWKKMDAWAIKGFMKTYKEFGSSFDVFFKESEHYDKAKPIIEEGLSKKVFTKQEDGSIIADLTEEKMGKKVVLRADGTSIYLTNDLALTKYKAEHYGVSSCIWVVGSEQNMYFQQLFAIFKKLGYPWKLIHISYGLVHLPDGRMKSREGRVVDADDIIKEMRTLSEKEVAKREKTTKKELDKRSRAIALGAIKFYLLQKDPVKDITFNPEESLSFEGDTGPYVQYTHARICSLLKKVKEKPNHVELLVHEKEQEVIRLLQEYPSHVEEAGLHYKPQLICNYLLQVCHAYNDFYHSCPVNNAEEKKLKQARVALCIATQTVIANGLGLLNIEAPQRM